MLQGSQKEEPIVYISTSKKKIDNDGILFSLSLDGFCYF